MGPSGSGKSTLMHIMAGLDAPTAGRVWLGDTDITELLDDTALTVLRRRRVGFVFQSFNLVPTLDVRGNVLLPFELDGRRPTREEQAWIDELVDTLGLSRATAATARTSSRAGSSSAWRSPAPSRPGPTSSSPTSPPATSTPAPDARCSALLAAASATTASRSPWSPTTRSRRATPTASCSSPTAGSCATPARSTAEEISAYMLVDGGRRHDAHPVPATTWPTLLVAALARHVRRRPAAGHGPARRRDRGGRRARARAARSRSCSASSPSVFIVIAVYVSAIVTANTVRPSSPAARGSSPCCASSGRAPARSAPGSPGGAARRARRRGRSASSSAPRLAVRARAGGRRAQDSCPRPTTTTSNPSSCCPRSPSSSRPGWRRGSARAACCAVRPIAGDRQRRTSRTARSSARASGAQRHRARARSSSGSGCWPLGVVVGLTSRSACSSGSSAGSSRSPASCSAPTS